MSDAIGGIETNLEAFLRADLNSRASASLTGSESYFRGVIDALPAAVYITDATGLITYFNEAAVALWGRRPELGTSHWCGSWKLFWPDGRPMPHDQCPMAQALREQRPNRGLEAIAERPDGVRIPFMAYPTPLFDESGALTGALNMLVDITERKNAERLSQHLTSIVEFSDDAIVSKDLTGVITSWNRGAERLFGYTAEEIVGRSITVLIPPENHDEEPSILRRIRRGEQIDHYETVRVRKDGSRVDISLTVSPIKDATGKIVGASKIARDISDRKRAEEQQHLLLREMDHRVKNLFAVAGGVVALSARSADSPKELSAAVQGRLAAMARAHALTLTKTFGSAAHTEASTTMHSLIRAITSPYESFGADDAKRVVISGPDLPLASANTTSFALLLHEFTTNAVKYGALSTPTGVVKVDCAVEDDQFVLLWQERGGPPVAPSDLEGFGTVLSGMTIKRQLDGEIHRDWHQDGLTIRLSVARDRLTGP